MTRLIVTRPAAQAEPWVRQLIARGVDAIALPLIEIAPPLDPQQLRSAWAGLAQRRLVVFVSANAVAGFWAARPAGAAWPPPLLAAAPGPGTAAALRAQGLAEAAIVEPAADAPQLDSESLWQRLGKRDWNGASVLVVRGDGGRDWLVERLAEAGARVDTVAAYRRLAPRLSAAARQVLAAALAEPARHLWFFSSSEAIANLEALDAIPIGAAGRALVTHPRIAARARQAGFGAVSEVHPGLDAVLACIQSMQP
ncbi:MAG: uroporphyrinogen-III synthase [Caldimonas sp.]